MSEEALAVRPWKTPASSRLGLAGLFVCAFVLTGCGTTTRVRTAEAPVVAMTSAMPPRVTPPAGTVFAPAAAPAPVTAPEVATAPDPPPVAVVESPPPVIVGPIAVVAAETDVVAVEADAQDRSVDATLVAQARGRAARSDKDD